MATPNQSFLAKQMQWRMAVALASIIWDLGSNVKRIWGAWNHGDRLNDVTWWPAAWRKTKQVFSFRPGSGGGGGECHVEFSNARFDPERGDIWYGDKKIAENVLVDDDAKTKIIRNDSDSTIHVAYEEEVGLTNSYSAGVTKGVTLDMTESMSSETTAEVKVSGEYMGVSAEAGLSETFGISKEQSRSESKEENEERSREGSRTEKIAIEFDAEPRKHYLVTISKEHATSYQPFSIRGVMDFDMQIRMPQHSSQQHGSHHPADDVRVVGMDGFIQFMEGFDTDYPAMQGFIAKAYSGTKAAYEWLKDAANRYIEVEGTKEASEESNATYQVESLGGSVPDALANLPVVDAEEAGA